MARSVKTINDVFSWCIEGKHNDCKRSYERFHFEGKKITKSGQIVRCQCTKRGCKCQKQKKTRVEDVVDGL